jgi:hypothetical protein
LDTARFDHLTRTVSTLLSRRTLAGALGLGVLGIPGLVDAKKNRKKNKKKVKFNDFECVDVGKFCKNGGQCCSGICQGKKGKKTCKGHDQSTCQALPDPVCTEGVALCMTSTGEAGSCLTTTGNAGYCQADGQCFACTKDADCVPFCGSEAACIFCGDDTCTEVGGTACVGVSPDSCAFP